MKIIYFSAVIIVSITALAFYLHLCKISKRFGKYQSITESTFPLFKTINLDFRKDRITLFTGCNTLFAEYVINNNQLIIDKLIMTKKSCDEGYLNLEFLLNQFISGKPEIKFEKDKIILKDNNNTNLIFQKINLLRKKES